MDNVVDIKWNPEERKLSKLKEYKGAVREYSIQDLEEAKKSIDEFGLIEPLVVNSDGTIIDGHLRYNSMLELGMDSCMVTFPDRKLNDEELAEAYYRKNRNIAGVWDIPILRKHWTTDELREGGFSEYEIQEIESDPKDIVVDDKPKVFPYDLVFDEKEDKEVCEELLSKIREKHTEDESIECSLVALIKKRDNNE